MPLPFGSSAWWVELLARSLSPADRDTVLGDLAEAGETDRAAFCSIAGLLVHRQFEIWRNWRPWVAAFGLAMPASFLLMGFSLSIAKTYQHVLGGSLLHATGANLPPGVMVLLGNLALLAAWSATGGFAVGILSRRTTWMSALCSLLPCAFCLARFRIDSLSRLCLLLFLPPALAGLCLGLRTSRIRFSRSLAAALVTTALTLPHWSQPGPWLPNWLLSWPAWYLVAIARPRKPLRIGWHGK